MVTGILNQSLCYSPPSLPQPRETQRTHTHTLSLTHTHQILHYLAALSVFVLASLHLPAPRVPVRPHSQDQQQQQQLAYYLPVLYFSIPLILHALDLACRAAAIIKHSYAGSSSRVSSHACLVALAGGATRITVGGSSSSSSSSSEDGTKGTSVKEKEEKEEEGGKWWLSWLSRQRQSN